MENEVERAARIILSSKYVVGLTGAGISVESGIRPFRGPDGIWTEFGEPPMDGYQKFQQDPKGHWEEMLDRSGPLSGFIQALENARPHPAHYALAKLEEAKGISQAFILDFDLHFGDGTNNIFRGSQIAYFQPGAEDRQGFLEEIKRRLEIEKGYQILAVSAGFDRHEEDWGQMLKTDDYRAIGRLVKDASQNICQGRRFAVLEGGYNHQVLGKNVKAFLEGLE